MGGLRSRQVPQGSMQAADAARALATSWGRQRVRAFECMDVPPPHPPPPTPTHTQPLIPAHPNTHPHIHTAHLQRDRAQQRHKGDLAQGVHVGDGVLVAGGDAAGGAPGAGAGEDEWGGVEWVRLLWWRIIGWRRYWWRQQFFFSARRSVLQPPQSRGTAADGCPRPLPPSSPPPHANPPLPPHAAPLPVVGEEEADGAVRCGQQHAGLPEGGGGQRPQVALVVQLAGGRVGCGDGVLVCSIGTGVQNVTRNADAAQTKTRMPPGC